MPPNKPLPPCVKDCEMRSEHCHSQCVLYATYKQELDAYNDYVRKYKSSRFMPRKKQRKFRKYRITEDESDE